MMVKKSLANFHNYDDYTVHAYETYTAGQGWTRQGRPSISIEERSLSYRFYPHFHPYVLDLIKRLNMGSVAGLQAADTDYQYNSDGSLKTLPNSTRGTLSATMQVSRVSDGSTLTLLAGTPLTFTDGTVVTIPDNTSITLLDGTPGTIPPATQVTLPGSVPVSFSSGTQFAPGGAPAFILPDNTTVTFPNSTQATLSDGTQVTLLAAAQVGLRSGVPLPKLYEAIFSQTNYDPSSLVEQPYPVKDLDFTISGAYSIYNWELFFHIPLLIAIHLSQNQQFKDAQQWFHYIFDPTDDSNGPTPERFWKVNPFQTTDVKLIEKILVNLSTGLDPQLQQDTIRSIAAWLDNPFQPFVVGRYRPTAFMLKTVMAYLDNLIAWGDSLFQQYTIETINEATQTYVLAANILGPRPQVVPTKGSVGPQTYADLRNDLDRFGNALRDMEVDIPFDIAPHPAPVNNDGGGGTLTSIGQSLYFCIPRNDKLLAYWDTVADRLFKIHNSLNLQGVFQQLPLFEPPIDPALLVRAAAAGLNVSAIVSGLYQPLPLVRFQLLVSKASEIAQEVKSLGNGLLSALEKSDNEALALLRAQHETIILGLAEMVKYSQWQEARKAREGLEQSLENAKQRYTYYQRQLGTQDNQINIPSLDDLDENSLETFSFKSSEPQMTVQSYTVDISQGSPSVSDGEMRTLSSHEVEELNMLEAGRDAQLTATGLEAIASTLALIPQIKGHGQPMGMGATVDFGGQHLHSMTSSLAAVSRIFSEEYSFEANKTSKLGSYARRQLDWINQSNLAIGEINLIFKQLRAAQIREAIAHKEYKNHQTQMQQAQDIENFLQNKETDQGFYTWMKREVKALYNQCFQLAFEVAKKAERALQNELGDPSQSYIQFTYLDGTEGLLAGEKLHVDIKRMEMAYHDLNQREYELTRHVSLLQVAPLALLQLRATGSCTFSLPEELFDLDCPGHYFRRIKSVAVSIPCVTGPYASVNCTVTLLKSSIRTSSQLSGNGYPRSGPDDTRFSDYYGSIQSIVTSSGQSDSGLFETNLRDERYLPFELSGAVSQWRLDLPSDVRQFDFDTITDVILHIRYTARGGGDLLAKAAVANLQTAIKNAQTVGSVRLFSIRHEFPTEWAKFRNVQGVGAAQLAELSLTLRPEHYPFWSQVPGQQITLQRVEAFAQTSSNVTVYVNHDKSGDSYTLGHDDATRLQRGTISLAAPLGKSTLYLDNNSMDDLWLTVAWGH
jgi:Tc toxin complex TcA C-terminal TcB-binding domain